MQMMVLDRSRQLGIDNNEVSYLECISKFNEEADEVVNAYDFGDMDNLQEELLDTIQVCIGMLDKLDKKDRVQRMDKQKDD